MSREKMPKARVSLQLGIGCLRNFEARNHPGAAVGVEGVGVLLKDGMLHHLVDHLGVHEG